MSEFAMESVELVARTPYALLPTPAGLPLAMVRSASRAPEVAPCASTPVPVPVTVVVPDFPSNVEA
jgi:hypothetical protein